MVDITTSTNPSETLAYDINLTVPVKKEDLLSTKYIDQTIDEDIVLNFMPFVFSDQGTEEGTFIKDFEESLQYIFVDDDTTVNPENVTKIDWQAYFNHLFTVHPVYQVKSKKRDTSPGGNDVINPYPQFCEDDDIIWPMTALDTDKEPWNHTEGMGRVYSEIIDDRQRILWLRPGLPEFAGLLNFWKNCIDSSLSVLMNTGKIPLGLVIGKLLGTAVTMFVALPFFPIILIDAVLKNFDYYVTKYVRFVPSTSLYFKMVNGVLAYLSVTMHLNDVDKIINLENEIEFVTEDKQESGSTVNQTVPGEHSVETNYDIIESIWHKYGCDIVKILLRKGLYDGLVDPNVIEEQKNKLMSDNFLEKVKNKMFTTYEKIVTGVKTAFSEYLAYIGIKIEKGQNPQESVTNSSSVPEIAEMFNTTSKSVRKKLESAARGKIAEGGVLGFISDFMSGVKNVLTGALASTGITNALTTALQGYGLVDIPELWEDSRVQTSSINFRIKLEAVYGNLLSIFYDIYLPLTMLICLAFPRAVGRHAYTGPFYLQAYCKGFVGINFGMIDSMTITRGADEHGWTYDYFPLVVNVDVNIKNLSPILYIPLVDSAFKLIFGQFSTFEEYMYALGGTSIHEIISNIEGFKRKFEVIKNILNNNTFNVTLQSMSFAERFPIIRTLGRWAVHARVPGYEGMRY